MIKPGDLEKRVLQVVGLSFLAGASPESTPADVTGVEEEGK